MTEDAFGSGGGAGVPPFQDLSGHPGLPSAPAGEDAPSLVAAGFWIRALARAIDMAVHMGIVFLVAMPAGAIIGALSSAGIVSAGWVTRLGTVSAPAIIGGVILICVTQALYERLMGASVGKLVCGLRVLGARNTEDLDAEPVVSPVSFGAALIRSFAYLVDSFFCGVVGYLTMSNSRFQQRLGDQWAKTVVVRNALLRQVAPALAARSILPGLLVGVFAHAAMILADLILRAL